MTGIITALPMWTKNLLRPCRDIPRAIYYYGNKRVCPVCCKSSRRFSTVGDVPRKDALCVRCGAMERHRLLWLYLSRKTDIFDGQPKKMLHISPEKCFESRFKKLLGDNYLTADLYNQRAMVKMDITNIEYAAESFDVILCSHVLEHVQDDKKAMQEINRVLKSDGWAILLVPINVEKTFEDPSIIDPVERLKYFGQKDHVRVYGIDYVNRLREAGFIVEISEVSDIVQSDEVIKMGLASSSCKIFYCTK